MDHLYSHEFLKESCNNEMSTNINVDKDEDDIKIDEKKGDDYLIDLYRERRFLYDKRDRNFKDNEMKANAWLEVSKIMIEKNCGNYYTPEYCQKRMKTLREKFSRLQKNEQNTKSGSAASTEKKSPLLNQMSFLNTYIQRRRTISNVIDVGELEGKNSKENTIPNSDNNQTKKPRILESNKIKESNNLKRKTDDEDILNVITNLTNSIIEESSTSSNLRTAENVFAEYIALELEKMSDRERIIKKQKLMEVLSTPLEKI